MLKNNAEYQGRLKVNVNINMLVKSLDKSYNVCEYEVNRLTNEKVIRGKRNLNENDAARPPGLTNL